MIHPSTECSAEECMFHLMNGFEFQRKNKRVSTAVGTYYLHQEGGADERMQDYRSKLVAVDIFFHQITILFIRVCVAFVFELQTLESMDFTKFYQLKGLKLKSKGHTNFYEVCDLTKNVSKLCTLVSFYHVIIFSILSSSSLSQIKVDSHHLRGT